MHPSLFLLLFISGVSSYFPPLEKTSHLQSKTKYSLVDEILCLLKAEKATINEKFFKPLHVRRLSCAHNNTEKFIDELKKIPTWKCMRKVEKGMQKLEKICYVLKKSPSKDQSCSEMVKTSFSGFKEGLEEFLRWVNQKLECSNVGRSESDLYLGGNCTCRDPWKSQRALG